MVWCRVIDLKSHDFKAGSTLQLGSGTEYNYSDVKKMAGGGLIYLKEKQRFQFVFNPEAER